MLAQIPVERNAYQCCQRQSTNPDLTVDPKVVQWYSCSPSQLQTRSGPVWPGIWWETLPAVPLKAGSLIAVQLRILKQPCDSVLGPLTCKPGTNLVLKYLPGELSESSHAPRKKHTHVHTWMYTDTSHVISSKTLASCNLNHKTATLYTISHWEDWTSSFIFLSNHCHIQMDTKSKLCLRMSLEIYSFPIFSATAFQFKPASSLPRPVAIVWFFFHLNFLYH